MSDQKEAKKEVRECFCCKKTKEGKEINKRWCCHECNHIKKV